MKISVMGLGYVGTVTAGCLAEAGHEVIGVDTGRLKVDLVNAGRSPVIEKDLDQIIRQQVPVRPSRRQPEILRGEIRAAEFLLEADGVVRANDISHGGRVHRH